MTAWLADTVSQYGTEIYIGVLVYFGAVSLFSAILTIADKIYAKKAGHRRIPEATLLSYAAFGGSVAMLFTMLMIRHKTRHAKFMVGLPIIILFQAVVLLWMAVRL